MQHKRYLAPLVAALMALSAALAGSASATSFTSCEPIFEGQPSILAHGTSCQQAQRVTHKVYVKGQEVQEGSNTLHAIGWTCHLAHGAGTPSGPERAITCHRGSKIIKAAIPG
jgi:hypothetical protein